jgi:hypothetical protein
MIRNICTILFLTIACSLGAIEYDIQDIGTLQTKESHAIAINNQGLILGWYNIDGSSEGKRFFVRDRDGSFHELPSKENGVGWSIDWRYLTNDGKAFGTFDGNANYAVLYVWDLQNDVVRLGNLPGKEISAINDKGQVLIKSVVENENGKTMRRPIIWYNGNITKLKGLEGNIGIESDESYGLDMNNKGEVVGQSTIYLSYKNTLYRQTHAVKWINGIAFDLHRTIPKTNDSQAIHINDNGCILLKSLTSNPYLLDINGISHLIYNQFNKINNTGYIYGEQNVCNINRDNIFTTSEFNQKINSDYDSIWMYINKIININDNGEIIAQGKTIYGEEHAVLLIPIKPN